MKLWKIFNNWRGRKDESSSIFPKKNRADLIREEGQKVGGRLVSVAEESGAYH